MIKRLNSDDVFCLSIYRKLSLSIYSLVRKTLLFLSSALLLNSICTAADIELPVLGDTSSGIVSKNQEYKLGKTLLQAFRRQVSQYDDPLLQSYLERLVFDLVSYSDLQDSRLTVLAVNSSTFNAFAMPGGIVGLNTGIFSYADNEDQLVSIIAHELAHLSQRHFARGIEARRSSSLISMAGLLATLVVSSTEGTDAGLAALSATQALTLEQQLRYSRSNEQEADRIGLKTMIRAGRDPSAVADMLDNLHSLSRYNSIKVPEFLRTHPLTEKRVADAKLRTYQKTKRHYPDNPEFYIMQARTQVALHNNADRSIKHFNGQLGNNTRHRQAAYYGLALAYLKKRSFKQAADIIDKLLVERPNYLPFLYADIEINIASKNYQSALTVIERHLKFNRKSYPLRALKADALWKSHNYEKSAEILTSLTKTRPEDHMIWYKLAEVRGLAGDISGVHRARAEYFVLIGALSNAKNQLQYAAKLLAGDFKTLSVVKKRISDIAIMEQKMGRI